MALTVGNLRVNLVMIKTHENSLLTQGVFLLWTKHPVLRYKQPYQNMQHSCTRSGHNLILAGQNMFISTWFTTWVTMAGALSR